MNRDVGRAWIAALRSGEFTQGRHALATRLPGGIDVPDDAPPRYGYCCLGVLCELALRAEVLLPVVETQDGRRTYDGEMNYLPLAVIEWAGLGSHDPVVSYGDDDGWRLSDVNDRVNSTFTEIADVIEAQLADDDEENT